ncbi:MAG: hypothetical protein R6U21_00460 [Thermoplasmatota archaeon]
MSRKRARLEIIIIDSKGKISCIHTSHPFFLVIIERAMKAVFVYELIGKAAEG